MDFKMGNEDCQEEILHMENTIPAKTWLTTGESSSGQPCIYTEETGETVALCYGLPEAKSNAFLIAAAPDLLRACKIAMEWLEDFSRDRQPYLDRPAAVIARLLHEAILKSKEG